MQLALSDCDWSCPIIIATVHTCIITQYNSYIKWLSSSVIQVPLICQHDMYIDWATSLCCYMHVHVATCSVAYFCWLHNSTTNCILNNIMHVSHTSGFGTRLKLNRHKPRTQPSQIFSLTVKKRYRFFFLQAKKSWDGWPGTRLTNLYVVEV